MKALERWKKLDDYVIIKKILNGDNLAFEDLVRKYYQGVYSYCNKRFNSKEIAEDLTQDIFLKLVKSIYQYSYKGKFSNFLFTITINTCTDYIRKKKFNIVDDDIELQDSKVDIEECLISRQENENLTMFINELPDIQRDTIILFYYSNLKIKEIAKIKNVPISTVKSRLKQGIDKLKIKYSGKESVSND